VSEQPEQQEQAPQVEIVRARPEHVAAIAALAASRGLDRTPDPSTAARDGFLVSDYTEDTYRQRLTTAEHFYVALKGDNLLGFVLAYSDAHLAPDEWLNRRIRTGLGSFLVIKQVCVATGAARSGIASYLYHHVLDQWTMSPVVAAVVADPPNHASTAFHRKLGFQPLTELTPPDGRPRKVWVWHRKPREAILQAQYAVAVDLYKHEDDTNWNKLNNFFYITAALAAATGFVFGTDSHPTGQVNTGLAMIIAVIGFGSSLAFSQMLRWGRRYLLARKAAVIELEEMLAWHGGTRIVGRELTDPGNSWLRSSPTGLIMMMLPVLVAVCWVAILILVAAG
jgi:predicted GNAT superfamily acetyltransferase